MASQKFQLFIHSTRGRSCQVSSLLAAAPPLEEAPSFRRHISGVKMAQLLLPAISTSLLPSLLPYSHNFAPLLSPAPSAPLLFQFKQKPQSGSSVSARWTHGRFEARLSIQLSKRLNRRDLLSTSENQTDGGKCCRHSPSQIRRRRRSAN